MHYMKVTRSYYLPTDFAEKSKNLNRSAIIERTIHRIIDDPKHLADTFMGRVVARNAQKETTKCTVTIDHAILDEFKALCSDLDMSMEQVIRLSLEAAV